MSLQLEQNLYAIYQLVLKLPRYILYACLILLTFIAISQVANIYSNDMKVDLSGCMLNYILQRHNYTSNHTAHLEGDKLKNISANASNLTNDEYQMFDAKTVLNIEMGSDLSCST